MKALVLKENCEIEVAGKKRQIEDLPLKTEPLELVELPIPKPGPKDILIRVSACGVCRTELDQIEGRISPPKLPVIPGHQPVGTVAEVGTKATRFKPGDRVGGTWLYSSCGQCRFCRNSEENLCEEFQGTGCHADGGYAEYMVLNENYAQKLPENLRDPVKVAPLMCAGVVGYRSLKLTGMADGKTLGLYGFGSANHLVIQMANFLYPNSENFVVSRNPAERELARQLGADWAGDISDRTPKKLDCAIDTTPAWKPVLFALENLQKGGRLVINLIRKEPADKDLLFGLDYPEHLWWEKEIKSVANVTRQDGQEFLGLAAKMRLEPEVQEYGLAEANKALVELKSGQIRGSKVLRIGT
ncbi:MAG: zinc-binding alcohol dehydrogenase family protein [Dehalococcoidia bacterium]|jgi:propanol-preferring alcohol dehydrogenase|nr:MAG: zinc-binding alcohol dehydrogenase family protein [Dehalococcoidia bacterium]